MCSICTLCTTTTTQQSFTHHFPSRWSAANQQVKWIKPGSKAAAAALDGFLQAARLKHYDSKRNDPTVPNVLSGLSPYLHYGQLAPQRAAIAAAKCKAVNKVGTCMWHGGAGTKITFSLSFTCTDMVVVVVVFPRVRVGS